MQSSKLSDWQNPFVDVFKRYNTFETLDQAMKGRVTVIHDPAIARKCIKLSGTVPSNSTVNIPTPNTDIKHCDLTGRYLYLELFVIPESFFIVHVDIAIKDRQPGVRFTITNMDKEYTINGGNVLKIPYHVERAVWTILCIDIEDQLENHGLFPKGTIKSFKNCYTIKGFQICANTTIRGIYTSPNIYDWDSLPKEMSFKLVKGGRWSDQYNFVYLPASTSPDEIRKKMRKEEQSHENEGQNKREDVHANVKHSEDRPPNSRQNAYVPIPQAQSLIQQEIQEMPSEPLVDLNYALAFSPIHNPDILYRDNTLYYSSGSLVVAKSLVNGEQTFLQGHTDYICAMDAYDNWIVTVQKGAKAIVRVWVDHKCVNSFQAPQEKVQQLRLNRKKHIAMVATDVYNRQVITVFDISQVETKKRALLLARQVSDFNILTLKFSPVEPDKLVSCGRENIRFWRIKSEHLPGAPVILKHHARNTIFTVLDFQYAYDNPNPIVQQEHVKSVYVGSQNGLLFQVNYQTHELEEVYKLHESAICSIMMSVGFCVTGGEDQVLRVWPLDFTQYILEAQHEGIITSLALSEDGMHVACGTSSGGLGVLDLTNHNYKTILRSHTDAVIQLVYHEYSGSVITLSDDLTIRLWDPQKLEQTYEFLYPKEDPCTCISGNPLSMFFAAGFKSGMLRIFDIEKTSISEELKQHQQPIEFILYSPDGKFLAVLEKKLAMLYSPLHSHQAVKHLPIEIPSKYQSCSFSPDSNQLAIIGDSGTHINIWELKTLQMIGKLFTSKVVRKVKFAPDGTLWVLFEDAGVRRYNLTNMTIEAEMQALHRGAVNDIDFDLNAYVLFSVGEDSLLKVWDYSFQREPHQVNIGHVGNINGVLYKDGRIWTIGSEGILQWNMKKDIPTYDPPFIRTRAANFIKNNIREERSVLPQLPSVEVEKSVQPISGQQQDLINFSVNPPAQIKQEGPIMFSQRLKKKDNDELMVAGETKFVPQRLDMIFLQRAMDFKKSKKKEQKARIVNALPEINLKYGLPQKHFFRDELEMYQKDYQLKIDLIKQNQPQFKIRFLVGCESYNHDNLVWNYVFGWYAYTLDNLIVIETLNKERSQKIIPMPERIGSLMITNDMKKLICCSAFNSVKKIKGLGQSSLEQDSQLSVDSSIAGEISEAAFANIYVMSKDFEIEKKLSFHPKGIQSMCLSENGKYLISIGNFRECTVCVWELATGKLKASSFTLDKLNDVRAMDWASEGRNLEFATVGRDQVHFWALDRDDKLEYYDVFIPKGESGEIPEITACEYIYIGESPKLLIGLTSGAIMAIEYGSFKVVLNRQLCSGPIIGIRNIGKKIIVSSADGNIYFWSYESVLRDINLPNFSKLNLQYSVNSVAFDPEGEEGLVGTSEGIFFANLKEQYSSMLVGSFNSPIILTKIVNQSFFITSHANGRLKLWSLETGEQIRTYKWKSPCREAFFDESLNKLICFVQNNNQIKLVNLNKFTRDEIYTFDESVKPQFKSEDYAIKTIQVNFGGRPAKWVFMRKGDAYSFEFIQEGRKKLVKMQKVLELGYEVESIQVHSEKSMIFAVSKAGLISSYAADLIEMNKYSLTIMDKVSLAQVSSDIKNSKNLTQTVEPSESALIQLEPSHVINETYFAICNRLQYVYFRNYMKRVTLYKISLSGIPLSIKAYENKKQSDVLIGLADGSIEVINAMQPENRYKVESIVNGPVEDIITVRSKQTVILVHNSAIALYTL